jgi:photosystem II stability/assembly factor-like uncharacterized protein
VRRCGRRRSGTSRELDGVSCMLSPYSGNFWPDWCWAVGRRGTILVSHDSGASWRGQRSGTSASLRGVFFIGPYRGLAVGAGGTILQTKNSGKRWTTISMSPATTLSFNAVSCQPGGARCWAVGSGVAAVGSASSSTWTLFTVAGTGGSCAGTTNACLNGVSFASLDEHFAVGGGGDIFAQFDYLSTMRWFAQLNLGSGYFTAIACTQPGVNHHGHCIAVGNDLAGHFLIYVTFASGSPWTAPGSVKAALSPLNGVAVLRGVSARGLAWAVGEHGLILRTPNGGSNWVRKRAPGVQSLEAVTCPNNASAYKPKLVCVAVGKQGTIITRR